MFRRGFRPRQDDKSLRLFAVVLGVASGVFIFRDSLERELQDKKASSVGSIVKADPADKPASPVAK